MPEHTFAFIIHPINVKRDVSYKFPLLGRMFSEKQLDFLSRYFPPVYISEITGIKSAATGESIKGWFIACPFTPTTMLQMQTEAVYRKIIRCGNMAEKLGAGIIGLGAYTSVVGDGGETIAKRLTIPVTNGNAYTIYVAIEAFREAARVMSIDLKESSAAVVGATGSIGRICSEILADEVKELVLVGRNPDAVEMVRRRCEGRHAAIKAGCDVSAIYGSRMIITVTSQVSAVVEPQHLMPGSVVLDVARPRDVSVRVAQMRDDVLVIEGGMVDVPGEPDFHFDFGFPPGKSYACMAETMALALEGRYEDYTVGKEIERWRVDEIGAIAKRHGFKLSGFRSFEHAVTEEQIQKVKSLAGIL